MMELGLARKTGTNENTEGMKPQCRRRDEALTNHLILSSNDNESKTNTHQCTARKTADSSTCLPPPPHL